MIDTKAKKQKAKNKLFIRSIEIKKKRKMLDFDFQTKHMKEEKDIASVENNKGCR